MKIPKLKWFRRHKITPRRKFLEHSGRRRTSDDTIPTLAPPPVVPGPVAYTEGMPEETEKKPARGGRIYKAKRPEWKPNQPAGGKVVRRMPKEIRELKEKQESERGHE